MIPPFYGQWESADRIGDILAGTLEPEEDPLWPRSGARDAADYARWAEHLCGMACIRMALAARGLDPPALFELARACARHGGYVEEADGNIRGLIYAPAIAWLRAEWNIAAEIILDSPAESIPGLLQGGHLLLASVHPWIRWPDRMPPTRGGHLVLVFAAEDGTIRFNNPSGDTPQAQHGAGMPIASFARFYAGRGVRLRGARAD